MADAALLAVGTLATVAVGAAAAGVRAFRSGLDPAVRRLRALAPDRGSAIAIEPASVPVQPEPAERKASRDDSDATLRLQRRLTWAGLRHPRATDLFVGAKAVGAFGLLLGSLALNAARAKPIPMASALPAWVAMGGLGFFLPNLWLSSRVAKRLREVERALPDALDLLVTCVEAGLGLDAALQRVADELALAWPLLSGEMRTTFNEVNAGMSRADAFRRLAERTGSLELRALSATLTQTEMFGTSIAAALRVQAEGIRIRRMQTAEEKAAYVAVKMTLPLILCILPALFAILIGPAIINIVEKLFVTMEHVR